MHVVVVWFLPIRLLSNRNNADRTSVHKGTLALVTNWFDLKRVLHTFIQYPILNNLVVLRFEGCLVLEVIPLPVFIFLETLLVFRTLFRLFATCLTFLVKALKRILWSPVTLSGYLVSVHDTVCHVNVFISTQLLGLGMIAGRFPLKLLLLQRHFRAFRACFWFLFDR